MPLNPSTPQTVRRASVTRSATLLFLLVALIMGGAPRIHAAAADPLVPAVSVSSVLWVKTNGSTDTLVVNGELPAQTPLPARLELPIPSGSTPDWVGEIAGGDPANDPTAEYTTRSAQGYDVVTLTLKQSRQGQVEVSVSVPNRTPKAVRSVSLPVLSAVGSASVAFQVPAGSEVSSLSAGLVKAGSSRGSDRYSLTQPSPRVGTVLRGSAVVAAQTGSGSPQTTPGGAAGAPTQSSASPTSATDVVLWGMLLGAVVFFLHNAYRFAQARSVRRASESAAAAGHPAERKRAPRAKTVSVEGELKRLQDLRSRGAMSRQEFLKTKRELLGDEES